MSLCAFSQISNTDCRDLITKTNYGLVQGRILQSHQGRPFYAYTKIPYAQPPVGENRFKVSNKVKNIFCRSNINFLNFDILQYCSSNNLIIQAPLPPLPWKDVLNAQEDAPVCAQKNYFADVHPKIEGQEDCLYLNVYTPRVDLHALLRVSLNKLVHYRITRRTELMQVVQPHYQLWCLYTGEDFLADIRINNMLVPNISWIRMSFQLQLVIVQEFLVCICFVFTLNSKEFKISRRFSKHN